MSSSGFTLGNFRPYVFAAFLAVFTWSIVAHGIPVDRIAVLLWMLSAFLVSSIGRTRSEVRQTIRDWFILVAMYMLYDYSRGTADQWGIPINYTWPRNIDRVLFWGHDPGVWLQHQFYVPSDVRWYDVVGAVLYMTHFVLPVLPLVMLRLKKRSEWMQYVRRFSLTLGIAVFTFIAFPAAPPWMSAKAHYMPPIDRITGRGWWELHLKTVSKTLDRGAAVLNAVAAMPSLHAGMSLLVTIWFTRRAARWVRLVALIYPLCMALTLVYFGEHYAIDCIAGWCVVLVAWSISTWWEMGHPPTDQLSN